MEPSITCWSCSTGCRRFGFNKHIQTLHGAGRCGWLQLAWQWLELTHTINFQGWLWTRNEIQRSSPETGDFGQKTQASYVEISKIEKPGNRQLQATSNNKPQRTNFWVRDIHLSVLKDMQGFSILTAEPPKGLWMKVPKGQTAQFQDSLLVVLVTNVTKVKWQTFLPRIKHWITKRYSNIYKSYQHRCFAIFCYYLGIQESDISSLDHCSSISNFSATSSVVPTKRILGVGIKWSVSW